MRTALCTFATVCCVYLAFALGCAVSNADFAYACAVAKLLDAGKIVSTPYFPPGLGVLLWLGVKAGTSALATGMLLSAIGAGFCAAAVAYIARLWSIAAAPAFMLGLASASLPSIFQVALNPASDSLLTGILCVILAAALNALGGPSKAPAWLIWVNLAGLALLCIIAMLLRYHAALTILPVGMILSMARATPARGLGLTLLISGLIGLGTGLGTQYSAAGSISNAMPQQIATGAYLRHAALHGQSQDQAASALFDDYAGFVRDAEPPTVDGIIEAVKYNWPQFMLRKSILIGYVLWLLGLAIRQRQMPGALHLALFIPLYALAVSPTYFTPRASALPELAGVMLAASGVAALVFAPVVKRGKQASPSGKLDPAIAGAVMSAFLLAGLGYNAYREAPLLSSWSDLRRASHAIAKESLAISGKQSSLICEPFCMTGWISSESLFSPGPNPYNLPYASWTLLWMDDPLVSKQLKGSFARYSPSALLDGSASAQVLLLWPNSGSPAAQSLSRQIPHSGKWTRQANIAGADLWVRR